jgi:hypothetical protein
VIDRFLFFFFSLLYSVNVSRCLLKVKRKSRAILLSLHILFVQKLHNTINSRPIIGEDQSRIFFSLSLFLLRYRHFFAFSYQPTIRAERAKAKRESEKTTKESDNGSLSHIVLCYEYFILLRKHIEWEREKKISIIIAFILYKRTSLVFLFISNHRVRCRQRKSHNVYSNKMKWTHI